MHGDREERGGSDANVAPTTAKIMTTTTILLGVLLHERVQKMRKLHMFTFWFELQVKS